MRRTEEPRAEVKDSQCVPSYPQEWITYYTKSHIFLLLSELRLHCPRWDLNGMMKKKVVESQIEYRSRAVWTRAKTSAEQEHSRVGLSRFAEICW